MSELNLTHSNGNKVKLTTPDSLAANKTFKLPSADGSAYSPIITDGSGALSFSSLKLPSSDGSSGQAIVTNGSNTLSFATVATTNGITMADQWRITSSSTLPGSVSILNSNWGRATSPAGYGTLGSAMTESSGVFTFPSNGHYYVESTISGYANGGARSYIGNVHYYSTNSGGSYSESVKGYTSGYADSAHWSITISDIYDVTDYSATRWKLKLESNGLNNIFGSTSGNIGLNGVRFIRLGDT